MPKITETLRTSHAVGLCVISLMTSSVSASRSLEDAGVVSLMYSDEEVKIMRAEEEHSDTPPLKSKEGAYRLDSLVYTNKENWAVWVNGLRLAPDTSHPSIQVISVTANEAELKVTPERGGGLHHFCLKPHQTYWTAQRRITEGEAKL